MYSAVDGSGCKANAHESIMMLCAIFLLISLQWKVWSPQQSCCLLHLHGSVLLGLKIGRRNFLRRARRVAQSGSWCYAFDLFMLTRGYDVCGDRMLGRKCRCFDAWVAIRLNSCPVRMLPQCVLSLFLALC
jgi:hypothetical protein